MQSFEYMYVSLRTANSKLQDSNNILVHAYNMGHSMSNQQGILGHRSDFDETWCVCSTYGAHHSYQLLASYTT